MNSFVSSMSRIFFLFSVDYIQNTTIHVIDIAGTGVGDWEKVATNIAWSADGNRPGHWTVSFFSLYFVF